MGSEVNCMTDTIIAVALLQEDFGRRQFELALIYCTITRETFVAIKGQSRIFNHNPLKKFSINTAELEKKSTESDMCDVYGNCFSRVNG